MASHAAVGCGCLGPSTALHLHLHLHLALHKLPGVARVSLRTYCLIDSFE